MAEVISKLLLLLISNRYEAELSPVAEHLSFWRGIKKKQNIKIVFGVHLVFFHADLHLIASQLKKKKT